jgi:hypothetical protein
MSPILITRFMWRTFRSLTLRMSHEGERARGARTRNQPERAPPHWLNPLVRRRQHRRLPEIKRTAAPARYHHQQAPNASPRPKPTGSGTPHEPRARTRK